MSTWDDLTQWVADAKAGIVNPLPARQLIPFEEIKTKALQNPEFRAEYERLRPEFEQAQADIAQRSLPMQQQEKKSRPVQRRANGRREHLMDYIPDKKLYAAVMFARKLMRDGQSSSYANGWAAKKYKVEKSDVAHYTGQVGGTVSGRRR